MFSDKHYVPAIKWKQGEYTALDELKSEHKLQLTPLVDIPAIPWDFKDERPAKSIDSHLDKIADQMAKAWGLENSIFVDLGLVEPEARMSDGRHPVDWLFDALSVAGVQAVPVTGTDRDGAYQAAVATVAQRDRRGICVRAEPDDFQDQASVDILLSLVDGINVDRASIDLILDMGPISAGHSGLTARLVVSALTMLAGATDYRTLTVLSGAFPTDLSSVPKGLSVLPRADWAMWLNLRSQELIRQPSFGDYTAAHPNPSELDPRIIQASASIRYAVDTEWVIARGRSLKSPSFGGYAQFNSLSGALVAHPLFTGASFSWSSDYVTACAAGGPTGNLTTWRKVATNRHLSRTAHQIANLP